MRDIRGSRADGREEVMREDGGGEIRILMELKSKREVVGK